MARIEYATGMWSESSDNYLTWGKGDMVNYARLSANAIVADLSTEHVEAVKRAGCNPDEFIEVDNSGNIIVAARILLPSIEECIAYSIDKRNERMSDAFSCIESGEAFLTAEIAPCGGTILWSRKLRDAEKIKYTEFYRDRIFRKLGVFDHIKVEIEAIKKIIGERSADGEFDEPSAQAWIITSEEKEQIMSLSDVIKGQKESITILL